MSAKTNQIILDAESEVGNQYYWAPMSLGLLTWMQGNCNLNQVGDSEERAICCFDLFFLLAARRGYLEKKDVKSIYNALLFAKANNKASTLGAKSSVVWKDWPEFIFSSTYWRPRRGDLVFFHGMTGGDVNHVVLSCGPNEASQVEVITFGEGLEKSQKTTVNRSTIKALRQKGHTAVKFVTPAWT